MRGISFFVPGTPIPWARAARSGNRSYTPQKQADYISAIRYQAMLSETTIERALKFQGPLKLEVLAVYPWPKRMSKKARAKPGAQFKTTRPDIDNAAAKLVLDALQGIVYEDDAQVVELHARKIYGDEPGLHVTISELSTSDIIGVLEKEGAE